MQIEEAIVEMRDKGARVKRMSWKHIEWIAMADPAKHPKMDGDDVEYSVFTGNMPLAGPFDTAEEAGAWLKDNKKVISKLWERYKEYQKKLELRCATPLDFAPTPTYTVEQITAATVVTSVKLANKRLCHTFLVAMQKQGRDMVLYSFTADDFTASDWEVA